MTASGLLPNAPDAAPDIAWSEIGSFIEAMTVAQRQLTAAAKAIRDEFVLGPRGPFILGQIASERVRSQSDLVRYYKVGRSIITEEVQMLAEAGLVASQKSEDDARQLELTSTQLGRGVNA